MPFMPTLLSYRGMTLPIDQWAARLGIAAATIRSRLHILGWTVDEALGTPPNRKFSSDRSGRPRRNMPRPCPPVKVDANGQAHVRWSVNGLRQYRYFGDSGSDEAAAGYRRFQLEWASGVPYTPACDDGMLVAELAEGYLGFAATYYVKFGEPTSELSIIRPALAVLLEVAADKRADEFTADDLRACQAAFIARGLTRRSVNAYTQRIRRMFDWGAGKTDARGRPWVPAAVVLALQKVPLIKPGRTAAKDRPKVRSVEWDRVEACFPHLNKHDGRRAVLEAAIRVHRLTGCRSSQLAGMLPTDISRDGDVWEYRIRPELDKTHHLEGGEKSYYLGPQAQAILSPLLADCPPTRPVFALPPRHKKGKGRATWTPMTRESYYRFVQLACRRAKVAPWFPHQLRHLRATEVDRRYGGEGRRKGIEAAAAAIGDTPETTARVYVDPQDELRRRIARESG